MLLIIISVGKPLFIAYLQHFSFNFLAYLQYSAYLCIVKQKTLTNSEAYDWLDDDSNKEKHRDALRHCYYKVRDAYEAKYN